MPAKNDLDAVVSDAAFHLIPELTAELKASAKSYGWPDAVVNALLITFDGENLLVDYPKNLDKIVDNLRYGTGDEAPKAAIQSFIYRSGETLKSVLAGRSVNKLFEVEGVFGG